MEHLVIIGNGITGTTVARHVRKRSSIPITIVSDESDHFFSRPALMYIYMGHMTFENTKPYEDFFWDKNDLRLRRAKIQTIDTDNRRLITDAFETIEYSKLVIATGSQSSKYGWPGQDLQAVQGLYNLQDLQSMESWTDSTRRAVIVGGGLIGVEMAEMFHTRHIDVTFLIREENYWDNILPREEAILVGNHIRQFGVELRFKTQLKEILPDTAGRVRAVVTDQGDEIACEFVGLTAGVTPRIDIVKNSKIETKRGVLVNEFLETNVPDVYAAGDCAEFRVDRERHPRLEQLWYTGRMQAQALAKTLCGERTVYQRGIWFNSAKFFDLEYQTYGFVANTPRPDEETLYWQNEDASKAVRLVWSKDTSQIIGFNTFGIRYRHEVCERWIREKRAIEFVLEHLGEANFDPEFFRQMENEVVAAFNQKTGRTLTHKKKRGLFRVSA